MTDLVLVIVILWKGIRGNQQHSRDQYASLSTTYVVTC